MFVFLGWCPPGSWCPMQTAYSVYGIGGTEYHDASCGASDAVASFGLSFCLEGQKVSSKIS